MGLAAWYEEKIVPRIITCACGDPKITALRARVVPLAHGRVFELGVGGGLNQPHYNRAAITSFSGIDPSGKLLDAARVAAREQGWDADIRHGVGEAIPFDDDSFDTVVCTYTLCSVSDQAQVVREMRRVLKPGGKLLFLEHGKSPDAGPARWQHRIEPVWKRLMGNCHLSREVTSVVKAGDLRIESEGSTYLEKMPRWAGWMEWGVAVKGS